ncbi:(2Fe-2S)-binding protein [Streptomyces crystallinus]|uniref:2Fe-2S ferredoxin-type domain-containing protein n=1 Tax=Streptomyces crystallinus TaxID=68191 RepID=A0ABN1GG73_9ACTN
MSENDHHARGTGGWQPVPQGGEYDDGATAFVQLPADLDALLGGDPLAAPGHGYVPPMIVPLTPAATTDPAATGTWAIPTPLPEPDRGESQVRSVQWPDASAVPAPPQPGPDPLHDPLADAPQDRHATGQWTFPDDSAQTGQLTGQWTIPVADGELPDESGEFSTSSLIEQWGTTPPATLPGGAPAPWATEQPQPEPVAEADPGAADARVEDFAAHAYDQMPLDARHQPAPDLSAPPVDFPAAAEPVRPEPVLSWNPPGPGATLPGGAPAPWAAALATEVREEPREEVRAEADPVHEPAAHEPLAEPAGGPETGGLETGRLETGGLESGGPEAGGPEAGDAPATAAEPLPEAAHPEPAHPEPAHPEPVHAEPVHQEPVHVEPVHVQPIHPEPVHPEPVHPESLHDEQPEPLPLPLPEAAPGSGPEAAPEPAPEPGPVQEAAAPDPEAGPEPVSTPLPLPEPEPGLPPAADLEHPRASYVLRVNGTDRPVTEAWVGESLLYVLRERLGLAGAKDGCSQGECGACNVQVDGRLVASCLVPAATTAGSEVRTVEGLAVDGEPSDVQRALAACGAVQCGFCIPGMAMTVHDLLEGNHAPTELETRQALCGNLCRCSGYRGVLDAVRDVVAGREAQSAAASEAAAQQAGHTGPVSTEEARIPHQAGPGAGGVQPPHTHDGGMA